MDQDDPEKRIADLEQQLAQQNPGSASDSVADQRRFVATRIADTRQSVRAFGLVMVLFLIFGATLFPPLAGVHAIGAIRPVLLMVGCVLGS